MTFDPFAAIQSANRVWPEPLSLPESLEDATELELAEARSLIAQIVAVGRELGKVIDAKLAGALQGSVMEYGGMVIRPNNGRGSAKVTPSCEPEWWENVVVGLKNSGRPAELLAALYPASSVRLTALPKLAAALGYEDDEMKSHFIRYDPPTSVLSVMPKDRAPKFLQDLEDGEIRKVT